MVLLFILENIGVEVKILNDIVKIIWKFEFFIIYFIFVFVIMSDRF